MGRVVDGLSSGVSHVQSFTDNRSSTAKVRMLSLLTVLIGLVTAALAVVLLVQLYIINAFFLAGVAGLAAFGFLATRNRRRVFLQLYALAMLVVMALHTLGLIWDVIGGLVTLSINLEFILAFIFVIGLVFIEGYSAIMAWSLAKDLNSSRAGNMQNRGAMEAGEQEFTFHDEESVMTEIKSGEAVSAAPVYHPSASVPATSPAVGMIPGAMPVYNPMTGVYGQHPAYAAAPPNYNPYAVPAAQPYAYPAVVNYPTVSPAPSTVTPLEGDIFEFASFPPEPTSAPAPAQNPGAASIIEDGEFDPFQERPTN